MSNETTSIPAFELVDLSCVTDTTDNNTTAFRITEFLKLDSEKVNPLPVFAVGKRLFNLNENDFAVKENLAENGYHPFVGLGYFKLEDKEVPEDLREIKTIFLYRQGFATKEKIWTYVDVFSNIANLGISISDPSTSVIQSRSTARLEYERICTAGREKQGWVQRSVTNNTFPFEVTNISTEEFQFTYMNAILTDSKKQFNELVERYKRNVEIAFKQF